MAETLEARAWRAAVAPYIGPRISASLFQLTTTSSLFVIALVLMYQSVMLDSAWAPLLAAMVGLPAAGLLVRLFIIMHDCAHGSFFPSRRAMDALGYFLGVLTFTPYGQWRRDHALHHACPSIPHYRLPEAKASAASAGEYPFAVAPGYLRSLVDLLRRLPSQPPAQVS